MNLRSALYLPALLALAAPAAAEICKYVDRDGNLHYSSIAPEKDWKKLSCGVGAETDYPKQIARGLAKVRVGMTIAQIDAIDHILVLVPERSELVTAAGKTELRRYPDGQQIVMRDGRVTAILR